MFSHYTITFQHLAYCEGFKVKVKLWSCLVARGWGWVRWVNLVGDYVSYCSVAGTLYETKNTNTNKLKVAIGKACFLVARVKKCQHTREDVSLQHVPETRRGNFFTSVPTLRFGPCHMFLLHSPATCPVGVYLTRFCSRYILQQHVPTTCLLVWAHL